MQSHSVMHVSRASVIVRHTHWIPLLPQPDQYFPAVGADKEDIAVVEDIIVCYGEFFYILSSIGHIGREN